MKKLIGLFYLAVFLFSACSEGTVKLHIDNPEKVEGTIELDSKIITLSPRSTTVVEVAKGNHTIKFINDSVTRYNFQEEQYLVKAKMYDYIIEKLYYSKSNNSVLVETFNKVNRKKVKFLGYDIVGNYEVVRDAIVPKDWDFHQREKVPEVITVANKKFSSSQFVRKLYATDEFLLHLKAQKKGQQ